MALKLILFTALVFATYPTHALDLKKELERLRGGADAKETQTHATSAAVGRAAPAAASRLGRAAFLDASRVAPPLTRLGAIVKPKDPYAFECNPYKHRKSCFEGQRRCRNGKKVFDDIRPCDDGEFLNNPPGVGSPGRRRRLLRRRPLRGPRPRLRSALPRLPRTPD